MLMLQKSELECAAYRSSSGHLAIGEALSAMVERRMK
jgi:hypothetical protein